MLKGWFKTRLKLLKWFKCTYICCEDDAELIEDWQEVIDVSGLGNISDEDAGVAIEVSGAYGSHAHLRLAYLQSIHDFKTSRDYNKKIISKDIRGRQHLQLARLLNTMFAKPDTQVLDAWSISKVVLIKLTFCSFKRAVNCSSVVDAGRPWILMTSLWTVPTWEVLGANAWVFLGFWSLPAAVSYCLLSILRINNLLY